MNRRKFFSILKIDRTTDPLFEIMEIPSTEKIQEEMLDSEGLPEDVRLATDALLWVCTHHDFETADKVVRAIANDNGDFFVKCIKASRKFTKTFAVHYKAESRRDNPGMVVENEDDYKFPLTTTPYGSNLSQSLT